MQQKAPAIFTQGPDPHFMVFRFRFHSLDFLFQFIKFRRAEKLSQRHIQPIAQLLDQINGNLLPPRIQHTIHAGRGYAGTVGQAEEFEVDTPAYYAALADAWLKDPDAKLKGRDKLEAYYKCIVMGK